MVRGHFFYIKLVNFAVFKGYMHMKHGHFYHKATSIKDTCVGHAYPMYFLGFILCQRVVALLCLCIIATGRI